MHFNFRASEISALAGRNVHRSARDAAKELVGAALGTTTPTAGADGGDPAASMSMQLRWLVAQIEEHVRNGPHYCSAVSRRRLDERLCRAAEQESLAIFDRFAPWVPPRERHRVRKSVRHMYLKDRGMLMELDALRRLPSLGIRWLPTEKRQRCFSRTFTATPDDGGGPYSYTINGCVDGFEFDAVDCVCGLIEVKTRKDTVQFPVRDLDQLMMYLVISGLPRGRLVQDVGGCLHADRLMTLEEAQQRWTAEVRPALERTLGGVMTDLRRLARAREAAWRPMPQTFHADVPAVVVGHGNRPIVTYVAEPEGSWARRGQRHQGEQRRTSPDPGPPACASSPAGPGGAAPRPPAGAAPSPCPPTRTATSHAPSSPGCPSPGRARARAAHPPTSSG